MTNAKWEVDRWQLAVGSWQLYLWLNRACKGRLKPIQLILANHRPEFGSGDPVWTNRKTGSGSCDHPLQFSKPGTPWKFSGLMSSAAFAAHWSAANAERRDQEDPWMQWSRRPMNAGIKKTHELRDQEDPWTQGSRRPMNAGIKKTHECRDQEDPWTQWSGTSMNAGIKKIHERRDQEDPWMQGLRRSRNAGIRKINECRDQEDQLM